MSGIRGRIAAPDPRTDDTSVIALSRIRRRAPYIEMLSSAPILLKALQQRAGTGHKITPGLKYDTDIVDLGLRIMVVTLLTGLRSDDERNLAT